MLFKSWWMKKINSTSVRHQFGFLLFRNEFHLFGKPSELEIAPELLFLLITRSSRSPHGLALMQLAGY